MNTRVCNAVDNKISYLNTDLDLTSTEDLTILATAFEARGLSPLYVADGDDGLWSATFETVEEYDEPEPNIASMLEVIESLPESLQALWLGCLHREFDIGYNCDNQPWAFNQGLSNTLLTRIVKVGASLRITLYPSEPEPE